MAVGSVKFVTTPLSASFGVEVQKVDLSMLDENLEYPAVRALFEDHSLLLFRDQNLAEECHLRLARMFGPIEDRAPETRKRGEKVPVSPLTNETADGGVSDELDLRTLNLKANQLWHTDSTFMPTPALCNILTAKVVTETGGETEFASTRAAWEEMPESLKSRIRGRILKHNFQRSREKISKELAKASIFNKWPPQRWPAVWTNPVNQREALYIASHVFEVEGLETVAGEALIEELTEFCTQSQFTYLHKWNVGDVLIWDERSTIHRGRPWTYDKPRSLNSVCVSLVDSDGLSEARTALHN